MKKHFSHYIELGLAIAVMSSSGTLGRYINLPPTVTIWLRCIIATIALYLILKIWRIETNFFRSNFQSITIGALFLGGHWVTYFYSLQLSSVAIGMLSLFTYPVITALLEPLLLKTKLQPATLFLSILAFAGVALLVPELSFDNQYTLGIAIGILSALLYSIRNILMKKKVGQFSSIALMYYQLLIITLVLTPLALTFNFDWSADVFPQWIPLIILGLFTTATGHTLFVLSFRHFTISTVSIISAITPLIGSTWGYIFLSEIPSGKTMIGGILIFTTVVIESIRTARTKLG